MRDLADCNKHPGAGPGDVIPFYFEKTRRMGNCVECLPCDFAGFAIQVLSNSIINRWMSWQIEQMRMK